MQVAKTKLKGSTVLVTLAIMQFASMQILLAIYGAASLIHAMRAGKPAIALRLEAAKWTGKRL